MEDKSKKVNLASEAQKEVNVNVLSSSEKSEIIKYISDFLSHITIQKAFAAVFLVLGFTTAYTMLEITKPEWKSAHIFPRSITREHTSNGCLIENRRFNDRVQTFMSYRFAAKGVISRFIGMEIENTDNTENKSTLISHCDVLRRVAEEVLDSKFQYTKYTQTSDKN